MTCRRVQRVAWLAPIAALSVACGSGATATQTSPGPLTNPSGLDASDDSLVSCANDSRGLSYAPGLSVASQDGAVRILLLASDPGPPVRGTNAFTVRVLDAGGSDISGAVLTVTPTMPDHGHSTTPPVVTANADGTYTVGGLYLYMDGIWQISFGVATEAGPAGSVDLDFCVEG
jgi:YtkA-like